MMRQSLEIKEKELLALEEKLCTRERVSPWKLVIHKCSLCLWLMGGCIWTSIQFCCFFWYTKFVLNSILWLAKGAGNV